MKKLIVSLTFCFLTFSLAQAQIKDSIYSGIWQIKVIKKSATNTKLWDQYSESFPTKILITNDSFFNFNKEKLIFQSAHTDFSSKDKIQLVFKTGQSKWNDSLWGRADLEVLSPDKIIGNYIYSKDSEQGEIKIEMIKIWCCNNHNPRHCGNAITNQCTGLH